MFENLSDVFTVACFKYLTAVDAEPDKSNQHEIGGLINAGFGNYLTLPDSGEKLQFQATMVYLSDEEDEPLVVCDSVTWYDSRFKASGRGPEWRLYYPGNEVTEKIRESDFFLISLTVDKKLLMAFCPQNSNIENQLRSLFGATDLKSNKSGLKRIPVEDSKVAVPIELMLSDYGIDLSHHRHGDDDLLESLLDKFGECFPRTRIFSEFARTITEDLNVIDEPDAALLQWMSDEERLFRLLERKIVSSKLISGFGAEGNDVDEFLKFSLSVQNRRKSRAGLAFENHIEELFDKNNIVFERGVNTEGKQKPDFLFPGKKAYLDNNFPSQKLFMLGAKTTCKERWRQVLAEANRIERKHLITIEPAISSDQTDQMQEKNVQLVVPMPIQLTYQADQRDKLLSVKDLISELPKK